MGFFLILLNHFGNDSLCVCVHAHEILTVILSLVVQLGMHCIFWVFLHSTV